MQPIRKNGKGVAKHLLGNMLHNVLIPDFGGSFKVAFNNACPDSLYKLTSLSTLKLARTSIFVSQNLKTFEPWFPFLTPKTLSLIRELCNVSTK